jgi:hypothetical protein
MSQLGGMDVSPFQRSQRERMLPALEGIESATSMSTLPSAQSTHARAMGEGIQSDPLMGGDQFNPQVMDLPGIGRRTQIAFPMRPEGEAPSEIEQLMRARQAEESNFLKQEKIAEGYKPRLIDGPMGPVSGFLGADGKPVVTERSGAEEGIRGLAEAEMNELSPERVEREAEIANTLAQLTRDEASRTVGQEAYARTRGGLEAQVDMAPAMLEAGLGPAGGEDEGLEVARVLGPLMADLTVVERLEQAGHSLPAFPTQQMESPMLQHLGQYTGAATSENLQMLNAANNWATRLTREFSGVQSRADEFNKFVTSLFRLTGDDDIVAEQKRNRRNAYMAAIMAGKRGGEVAAGRAFGKAITDGLIDPEAITYFEFGMEFERGMNEGLGELPPGGLE